MQAKSEVDRMVASSVVSSSQKTNSVASSNYSSVNGQYNKQFSSSSRMGGPSASTYSDGSELKDGEGNSLDDLSTAQTQSYSFLQMKCLNVLKKANQPINTVTLKAALKADGPKIEDPMFLQFLRTNPKIDFNSRDRTWAFSSAYKDLTSPEAILGYLREKQQDGLEITQELLDLVPEMEGWLLDILDQRQVRCVRGMKVARCKNTTGELCDLYSKNSTKCDVCAPLKGVCLYPREAPHLENVKIDEEIKELWCGIESIPMEDILQGYDVALRNESADGQKNQGRKRKKREAVSSRRLGKIVNTHIYSTEEFKSELQQQESAWWSENNARSNEDKTAQQNK